MKAKLFIAMITASLLASRMLAQGGSGMHGGFVHGGFGLHRPGNVVVPPLTNVVPPLGATNPGFPAHFGSQGRFHDGGRFDFPFSGLASLYGGDYAGYYDNGYSQASPSVVAVMPFAVPPPAPPPPPIRPETREYKWPASASSPGAIAFSIVSKDQRVQSAVAVWVQDHYLCYVAPDGSTGRVSIDSIDRTATMQRNAEKDLKLPLPPG